MPRKVCVHSLVGRPELNALTGTAVQWSAERERYQVRMDRLEAVEVWIKPANLAPVDESDMEVKGLAYNSEEEMLQITFFNKVMQGDVRQVQALLEMEPGLAHARACAEQDGGMNSTGLLVAAKYARTPGMLTALLDGGSDINARDALGGTPLMAASIEGDTECARLLLERNADKAVQIIIDGRPPMTAYDMAPTAAMKELLKPAQWDVELVGPGHVLGGAATG